jgi:excisionase family DNA binding protein
MENTQTPRLLLTVKEAGQLLGISRSKIYDLISIGKIRPIKIGSGKMGGVRFRPDDLAAFAQKGL